MSANTLQKDGTVCNHVSMLFIEDSKRLAMKKTMRASKSMAAPIHTDDGDVSLNFAKRSDSEAVKDGRSDTSNVVIRDT